MAVENDKVVRGKDIVFFTTVGEVNTPIAFATSVKLSVKATTREIKSKDNDGDWAVRLGDMLDYSISGDALLAFDLTGTNGADIMFNKLIAKQPVSFVLGTKSGTSPAWTLDSTKTSFVGSVLLTSFDINAGDSDNATYSFGGDAASKLEMITGS